MAQADIEDAFRAACAEELAALKPGNVHVHAAGHGMTVDDFMSSAEAAAPALCARGQSLGWRVLDAVSATSARVGQNTNLGIILLCAPLAVAAERNVGSLRDGVVEAIASSDLTDTNAVFRAIAAANPGGLGEAPNHDVKRPALVHLLVAMAEARERDSIARQWCNGFSDIFELGVTTYSAALDLWNDGTWAAVAVFLAFLSRFPDSHVVRKHGVRIGAEVSQTATYYCDLVMRGRQPDKVIADLLKWDGVLKRNGINPGTSADLTVATGFARRLEGKQCSKFAAMDKKGI